MSAVWPIYSVYPTKGVAAFIDRYTSTWFYCRFVYIIYNKLLHCYRARSMFNIRLFSSIDIRYFIQGYVRPQLILLLPSSTSRRIEKHKCSVTVNNRPCKSINIETVLYLKPWLKNVDWSVECNKQLTINKLIAGAIYIFEN